MNVSVGGTGGIITVFTFSCILHGILALFRLFSPGKYRYVLPGMSNQFVVLVSIIKKILSTFAETWSNLRIQGSFSFCAFIYLILVP